MTRLGMDVDQIPERLKRVLDPSVGYHVPLTCALATWPAEWGCRRPRRLPHMDGNDRITECFTRANRLNCLRAVSSKGGPSPPKLRGCNHALHASAAIFKAARMAALCAIVPREPPTTTTRVAFRPGRVSFSSGTISLLSISSDG